MIFSPSLSLSLSFSPFFSHSLISSNLLLCDTFRFTEFLLCYHSIYVFSSLSPPLSLSLLSCGSHMYSLHENVITLFAHKAEGFRGLFELYVYFSCTSISCPLGFCFFFFFFVIHLHFILL